MLNEEEGFYEVGPQQGHLQIFVLSVTIGLASNLAKVRLSPMAQLVGLNLFMVQILNNSKNYCKYIQQ